MEETAMGLTNFLC